jgi:ferredoxin/coenzyme F420-reducing hydrogenase delta subunit
MAHDAQLKRHLTVLDARPEPLPRGAGLLRVLERPFLALDTLVGRALPVERNPFAQTGAIANLTFAVAIVTGILLLFWYVPSVRQAYPSLEAMRASWAVELVRSLHRYSSDACVLFILLHSLRYFSAARFGGARWLAWVTGVLSVGLLWFEGWLGYWLVWDQRAQQVALGTARMLDRLPIFSDPLSRSFLTDESINTLLFFLVFFAHMLLPLLIVVGLWLHITRLTRPLFVTDRVMTAWTLGSLVLMSLVWPATSAPAAKMLLPPHAFSMDYFYLVPIAFTDRLAGGVLWLCVLLPGLVLFPLPWWMSRGRARPALVDPSHCNACNTCFVDCPYGAIEMVPRTDARNFPVQARVNPAKCVGCGICAGSCDSSAIGLPHLSAVEMRHNMDAWLARANQTQQPRHVAFVCASSAGSALRIDPESGECNVLPGYLVWAVPCAGWVHALTVQRALRHGAPGVLIVGCGHGNCEFREGADTERERLFSDRKPALNHNHAANAVQVVRLSRGDDKTLADRAQAFRSGTPTADPRRRPSRQLLFAAALITTLSAATLLASDAPYTRPRSPGSELVISFTHPGQSTEHCHTLTEEEKLRLPIHMRRDRVCDRSRADVRLRVLLDGHNVYQKSYRANGLYGDMNAIAMVKVPVPEGSHELDVAIGDTHDLSEWRFASRKKVDFRSGLRHVVVFDRTRGFRWF